MKLLLLLISLLLLLSSLLSLRLSSLSSLSLRSSLSSKKSSYITVNLFGFNFGKKKAEQQSSEPKKDDKKEKEVVRSNSFSGYGRGIFEKTGEKKEVSRVLKTVIFPGIYQDYEDTRDVKKTIKVGKTATTGYSSPAYVDTKEVKFNGKYNMMDSSKAPVYGSGAVEEIKLKAIKAPVDFKAPIAKKAIGLYSGVKCIPNVSSYPKPKKPIVIYDDEKSATCRKVREACSMLDLIVEYRPCPGATAGFTDTLKAASLGKDDIPFMFDSNPQMFKPALYGTTDIINHLFNTYGPGEKAIPSSLKGGSGNGVARGTGSSNKKARFDNQRMKPIQLYGWEGASYVKPVRECLNSLGLAHVMINCAEGSSNRKSLESVAKTFQVPYIIDPNTGVKMFESNGIVSFLTKTYTTD
jgi:hypothetical protein